MSAQMYLSVLAVALFLTEARKSMQLCTNYEMLCVVAKGSVIGVSEG